MPRPQRPGAPAPKRRSRNGCWPCKTRKVKCDETKPGCTNCAKQGEICDYSIRLNWEGRGGHKKTNSFSRVAVVTDEGSFATRKSETAELQNGSSLADTTPVDWVSAVSSTSYEGYGDAVGVPVHMTVVPAPFKEAMDQVMQWAPHGGIELESPALVHAEQPFNVPPFFESKETQYTSEQPPSHRPSERLHRYCRQGVHSHESGMLPPPTTLNSPHPTTHPFSPAASIPRPSSVGSLLTPSFTFSDDYQPSQTAKVTSPFNEYGDVKRLSINSLLSGMSGVHSLMNPPRTPRSNSDNQESSICYRDIYTDHTTYGIDRGIRDLDFGKNDDANAISPSASSMARNNISMILNNDESPRESGSDGQSTHGEGPRYYDQHVPVNIPRLLERLPHLLLENPMNLLYFHHFINHTADALIPHNCSFNPYKMILPQMAVRDSNLLKLLLAYSASHRARLLRQPEPAVRIAIWTQGIFSNLKTALDNPREIVSNENLATAIMLASLEIISPKAFGVDIPWQQHLETAREMVAARGGPLRMKAASRGDKVASFLWSWYAYLDVLGSLSGGRTSSSSTAWLDDDFPHEEDFDIDCVLGFTSNCIRLLARTAELGRTSDHERASALDPRTWQPSPNILNRAQSLITALHASLAESARPCTHLQSTGEATFQWDSVEMAATNEMFHWAGLIHLHRRIMAKPSCHPDVQGAVREIFGALNKIRRGSSAEACLLFPMFTAGCECKDEVLRGSILERIKAVEREGMMQMHQARTLMEKTWTTGQPWENLVAGEFLG